MTFMISYSAKCFAGSARVKALSRLCHRHLPGTSCLPAAAGAQQLAAGARTRDLSAAACCGCDITRISRMSTSAAVPATQRHAVSAAAAGDSSDRPVPVAQITVQELGDILADDDLRDTMQLIDVREPWEAAESSLPHFTLLPLSRQQEWAPIIAEQLDPRKHTVVLCHHGMRSNMVANLLVSPALGFENVSNVMGGIDAYSAGVDHNIPRY